MKLKRWISLFAALTLLLALLTGCADETEPKPTDSAPQASASAPVDTLPPDDTVEDTAYVPTAGEAGTSAEQAIYTDTTLTTDDPRLSKVVAVSGDLELTNSTFQIYYWMQFFGFLNQYGEYAYLFGLDTSLPLYRQAAVSGGLSWEQYFVGSAVDTFKTYGAVYNAALREGFTLPAEDQANLDHLFSGLEEQAAGNGFESVDAYIQASFGPGATRADYENYLKVYFMVVAYENAKYDAVQFTDEDLKAYYEAHKEEYDFDENDVLVDVRHILITPEDTSSEESKLAAKAEAERILAEYEKNPTEENFAALAEQYSVDPGSNTKGGLYTGVYQGQMVQTFNDWCFDASRQTGDTGIVETSYGYHVMYFVGSEARWYGTVKKDYPSSRVNTWIQELVEAEPFTVNYGDIVLGGAAEG